jgi:hypothetical protein
MHEDSIIALYYLVEPGLEGKEFELDFPNDITMDPLEQANLFQRNVASVLEAAPLITVEKAAMLIGSDVPEGVEPKMLLADYLNEVAQKLTPAPGDPGYQDYMQYEKGVVPASDKFNAQQKQKEQGAAATGKPGTKAKNDHMKRPNNSKKAAKDSETDEPEEEADQDSVYDAKLDVAQKLVKKMGYKEVDTALTALFGETLDKRVLVRLRNEK